MKLYIIVIQIQMPCTYIIPTKLEQERLKKLKIFPFELRVQNPQNFTTFHPALYKMIKQISNTSTNRKKNIVVRIPIEKLLLSFLLFKQKNRSKK